MRTSLKHREAIDRLGFVHRRLPTGDERSGTQFVPPGDFNQEGGSAPRGLAIPSLLVVVTDELTTLEGWDTSTDEPYQVTFDSNTPANIVNQAVAAAMKEVE